MIDDQHYTIQSIAPNDLALIAAMLTTFSEAFGENRPSEAYLRRLLGSDYFIALVALQDDQVVGGIAAYELIKFEQEHSEIYIYDLA